MRKTMIRVVSICMVLALSVGFLGAAVHATEVTDEKVLAVIEQLEAIDTLQQMQDKRNNYTVKNNHYDTGTTSEAVILEHETARTNYEAYLNEMFAARLAARQAYDALTAGQQAQIDPALVEKLSTSLPTVLNTGTFNVTPSDNEYTFYTVKGGTGYGYEVSHYMVSGNIPQTFVLVDSSKGQTSWTPSGRYVYGESNYDVAYCCDIMTALEYDSHYKRLNLEDSGYYGKESARHIRAILQNSYPFVTMEQMKANLKAGGLDPEFVDSLNRADLISAVQMAVWTYANVADNAGEALGYFASVSVTKNQGIYFYAMHDYTNEMWEWFPGKRQRSFDASDEYRVNVLAHYLCSLPGVSPKNDEILISDVEVTRAETVPGADDTYNLGMYVRLNNGGTEQDQLKVTITSSHTNADGSVSVTAQSNQVVAGRTKLEMTVKAKAGDTIRVVLEGTQHLARGVYFYEPEGGRDVSQSLVGVAEGETKVRAEESFVFQENVGEMGLRIFKTAQDSGSPLSDITFHIYKVEPGEGETRNETPTEEEIAKYAVEENRVGSVTTDATGYASLALEEGTYMVVEEFNRDKIKAPISPFYIIIPMVESKTNEDGTTAVEVVNIVSVYPKNEPTIPPEEPPILPPTPDNVTGRFQIVKHDELDSSMKLEGAQFQVYRAATSADTATEVIFCNGVQYAVVPVTVGGEKLVLTTDENGFAISPELPCDTYFLVETKAPAGYNLPAEAFRVTVRSSVMTTVETVEIPNQRGNILPETGGIGTTVFTATGALLILLAGTMLIADRRRAR